MAIKKKKKERRKSLKCSLLIYTSLTLSLLLSCAVSLVVLAF
jgi:hypothetical protein